jgi:hypothetical protein
LDFQLRKLDFRFFQSHPEFVLRDFALGRSSANLCDIPMGSALICHLGSNRALRRELLDPLVLLLRVCLRRLGFRDLRPHRGHLCDHDPLLRLCQLNCRPLDGDLLFSEGDLTLELPGSLRINLGVTGGGLLLGENVNRGRDEARTECAGTEKPTGRVQLSDKSGHSGSPQNSVCLEL